MTGNLAGSTYLVDEVEVLRHVCDQHQLNDESPDDLLLLG